MPSKQSLKTHQTFLRKFVREEGLPASRRLMAELLLLFIEEYIPLSLLESIYKNKPPQVASKPAEDELEQTDLDKTAQDAVRDLFKEEE
jgi:hypothetical protein